MCSMTGDVLQFIVHQCSKVLSSHPAGPVVFPVGHLPVHLHLPIVANHLPTKL